MLDRVLNTPLKILRYNFIKEMDINNSFAKRTNKKIKKQTKKKKWKTLIAVLNVLSFFIFKYF